MKNICYKVVFSRYGKHESASAHRYAVEYEIGKFVKPVVTGTPLFAFKSISLARKDFPDESDDDQYFGGFELYEAEYGRIWRNLHRILGCAEIKQYTDIQIKSGWEEIIHMEKLGIRKDLYPYYSIPLIPGTLLVTSIKLIRKISWSEVDKIIKEEQDDRKVLKG